MKGRYVNPDYHDNFQEHYTTVEVFENCLVMPIEELDNILPEHLYMLSETLCEYEYIDEVWVRKN